MQIEQYQKQIQSSARRWSNGNKETFENLLSEGYVEFLECQSSFDSNKACFKTFLFMRLNNRFGQYFIAQKQKGKSGECLQEEVFPLSWIPSKPESNFLFHDTLQNLKSDSKEIIQIIFDTPADLIDSIRAEGKSFYKVTKSNLKKYLKEKGWTHTRVQRAFKQIEKSLEV